MTPEEKEQLRQKLIKEIEKTKELIVNLEEQTQPISPDNAIGRLSRMEALNSKSVNEAALNDARVRLPGLESALAKIDNPDFGRCKKCKEPIPFGRLMYVPESSFCIKCARR